MMRLGLNVQNYRGFIKGRAARKFRGELFVPLTLDRAHERESLFLNNRPRTLPISPRSSLGSHRIHRPLHNNPVDLHSAGRDIRNKHSIQGW